MILSSFNYVTCPRSVNDQMSPICPIGGDKKKYVINIGLLMFYKKFITEMRNLKALEEHYREKLIGKNTLFVPRGHQILHRQSFISGE